jgi:predicted DCC family thiol-disulfide oxidoreductase YuxK
LRVLRAVERHWFAPARLSDLAMARILIVGSQLLFFLPSLERQLRQAAADPLLFRPLPALKVLMLPFGEWGVRPEPMFLQAVWIAAVVSGITALLGLYTRASVSLFAAANTLLIAHVYSYGEYHHAQAILVMALWLLALGPSGSACSLDDLFSRLSSAARFASFRPRPRPEYSEMARWPLRTVQWLLVLAYLSAGLSKLRIGGLQWLNGHTLSHYLVQDGVRFGNDFTLALAGQTELLAVLSLGAVGLELTFGLAVLVPALAWPYVLGGALLHLGIHVLQHATFFQYIVLYVVLIEPLREHAPWKLLRSRRRTPSTRRGWTVVYDGLCPRCIRTMVVLDSLDLGGRLSYLDLERDWLEVERRDPELTMEAARHAMIVLGPDGTAYHGYDAFRTLSRSIPALWPALPLFHLPLVSRLGRRVYAWLAARRTRLVCTADTCGAATVHPRVSQVAG